MGVFGLSDSGAPKGIGKVIFASSAGTLIEWYDFFVFGSLATLLSTKFFPSGDPTWALISTLGTFATGFVVRPFGAFFFGRIGDIVGRKYTFMLTLVLMGGATFAIGLLPTYAQVGALAPVLLILLRLIQGLALGGEYGGAATYVAEHSSRNRRGFYTSFIQTTATLGLFASILVIIATKGVTGEGAFDDWGWRIPFLLSIVLIAISYFIRRSMHESPLFVKLKKGGNTSTNPIKDSFGNSENRRMVLLALFGATAGQGVVWYTGQFYALFFMQKTLGLPDSVAYPVLLAALAIGTPFFVVFGRLSDRVGRKWIMLAGMGVAAVSFVPIYMGMTAAAGFDAATKVSTDPNMAMLIGLVLLQVLFVTMVYGPIAAYLVELFPTRIRYTSMSVPYHIGNGVFGGLVPMIGVWSTAVTGNMYAGLAYPILVALVTFVVGWRLLPETIDRPDDDVLVDEDPEPGGVPAE